MADINRAVLDTFFRSLRKDFDGALALAEDKSVDTFVKEIPMTSSKVVLPFKDLPGQWREWIGPRQIQQMASQTYEFGYRKWEMTLAAERDHITDDNLGIYSDWAEGVGKSAALLKPNEACITLANAHNLICYDGQNFFDTDHPVGEAGEGDQVSVSNIYLGDNSNAATPFYMIDSRYKPIMCGMREAPNWVDRVNLDDPHVFNYDQFLIGGRARMGFGFGFWQGSTKMTCAATFAELRAVRLLMQDRRANRKDSHGRRPKLGIEPDVIICGNNALADKLEVLLTVENINSVMDPTIFAGDSTVGNPFKGKLRLQRVSWLD
jgi:phage major head subunit gpT-like protein